MFDVSKLKFDQVVSKLLNVILNIMFTKNIKYNLIEHYIS